MKLIWIIVSCNSVTEAKKIGLAVLKQRLAACFEILPRTGAWFFWPPKKNKIESVKGCLLVFDTLPKYFSQIEKEVKKLHSDKTPFVGSMEIKHINSKYLKWLKGELKK